MPKYAVDLCRTAYRFKTVRVIARNAKAAECLAKKEEDGDWPAETSAEVTSEGARRVTDDE